ncbi:MAG: hypothetical protein KA028_01135 [Candidatus Pacebacteria bacterium]|nr:hypothetical protein [Candidatus Paceibacterota bacterium]MBP9851800.1 hypothetical protein [Candidatus Paceibacterota bacterium]
MHFPWRKKSTPEGQSVDGIVPNSKKLILSLREKVWKLEISPARIREFWQRNRIFVSSFVVILFVLVSGLVSQLGKAGIANFYAAQCLGGWENPANASGEPTLDDDAQGSTFNINNSAVLNNTQGDLYCGGFTGELPENTDPERISLKIHWTVDDGEVLHDVEPLSDFIDSPSGETIQTPEEQLDTPVEVPETNDEPQVLLPIIIIPESEAPTETETSQDAPQQTPESTPAPQSESSDGAFNFHLFKTAHAQEADPEQEVVVEQVDAEPAEVTIDAPVEGEPEVSHFMSVEYSVDGSTWIPFTKISRADWKNSEYVFPDNAFSWSEVAKLQVRLTSLASIDSPKAIYVDAVWLDVAYQTIEPDPLPQPDFAKDKVISYTENNNVLAVLVEREGERMLWYTKTEEGKYSLKELLEKKQNAMIVIDEPITIENETITAETVLDEEVVTEEQVAVVEDEKNTTKIEEVKPKVPTNQDALQLYSEAFPIIWTLIDTSGSLHETTILSSFESTLLWISPALHVFYGYNTNTNGIFSQSIDEESNAGELLFTSDAGEQYRAMFVPVDRSIQFKQAQE